MKKILIVFVAVCFSFASCKNENVVNPQITLGKATITGTVRADLDVTNDSPAKTNEKVSGKTVVASVSTKDLVSNPGTVTYGTKFYTTTTDTNGKYSIDVEVRTDNAAMTVTVVPQDFEAVTSPGTDPVQFIGNTAKKTVSVYNGGTFLLDITYP